MLYGLAVASVRVDGDFAATESAASERVLGCRPSAYALLGGALGDVRDEVLELAQGPFRLARAASRDDHRDLYVDDVVAHGERLLLLMLRGLLLLL